MATCCSSFTARALPTGSALSFVNLYFYGGGFDMAAALAAKISPFDLFETRRLVGAVVGIIGLAGAWRLGRRLGGPVAGVSALALLAACPIYYGHMFMNPKDAPFAAAMIVLLLGLVRAFDEYPAPGWRSLALVGVALGAAFGSRVLAALAAPAAAAALALIVAADARADDWRTAGARLWQFVRRCLPALVLAYVIMAVLWPWSVLKPFNPVYAALYFDTFFEKPWKELYDGALIAVPDMPWTYLPHLIVLKLPEIMLALGGAGLIGALVAAARRDVAPARRAGLLIVALSAVLPVAVAMVTRPALYNGIRQFLFIVPPFAVLGGLAAGWLIERAAAHGRAALAAVAASFRRRPRPFRSTAWCGCTPTNTSISIRSAAACAARTAATCSITGALPSNRRPTSCARISPSAPTIRRRERRWVVAICGPQASAEVELGPQFETTFDQKKADFALALGTFYCRHLQAPIIAEVRRDGVLFATVYDFRNVQPEKLLTLPPP